MPHSPEIRSIAGLQVRAVRDAEGNRSLTGMIPYNSPSVDLGGFVEKIAPGAFAGALANGADVLCLRDHKVELLMGRTLSGTLSLRDGTDGLTWTVQLPKTQDAENLAESVDRGDLNTNSFGFLCNEDEWMLAGEQVLRTLTDVTLMEISPCSFAAYPASTAALRSCPPEMRSAIKLLEDPKEQGEHLAKIESTLKTLADGLKTPAERSENKSMEKRDCTCDCDGCMGGDCGSCSVENCSADGCDHGGMADEGEWRAQMELEIEVRNRLYQMKRT